MTIPLIPESSSPLRKKYRYDSFVGRQVELEDIRKKIKDGQNGGTITRPVIHLWGVPGIGKSWLLQHLEDEYLRSFSPDSVSPQNRSVVPVRADFADLGFTCEDSSIIQLLKCLLERLRIFGESSAQAEIYQKCSEPGLDVETLTECFVNCIKGAAESCVLLFLFDAIEKVNSEAFYWLERELIAPLSRTDRMIFVIAGRKELPRWREFVVRLRLEVREIRGFSLSETQEQLAKYGVQEALSDIYPYTFGHPYANWVWARAWAEDAQPSSEKKGALIAQVEAELLKDISLERERDILRTLCALRKFNVESARLLLGAIIDPEFKTVSDGYYLRLFEAFEQSRLVHWDSSLRGYVIPLEVRAILQSGLRCRNPEGYFKAHQQALEMYEEWLEVYKGREEHFLPEVLYHFGRLHIRDGEAQDQEPSVFDLLSTHLASSHFDVGRLDNFYRAVREDQELEMLFPPAISEAILSQIERARKEMVE